MQNAASLHKPALKLVPDAEPSYKLLLEEDKAATELHHSLSQFVNQLNDEYLNHEPWFVFNAWLDCQHQKDAAYYDVFRTWQMFHWTPDPKSVQGDLFDKNTPTISLAYLKAHHGQLSKMQIHILSEAQKHQLDLYEVIGLNGQFLTLYGLICRKKVSVYHPALSSTARIGEYLLAGVLPIDQMRHIFLGASQLIPRQAEPLVQKFCKFIDRCDHMPREFKSFESDAFNLFYDLHKKFSDTAK